MLPAAPIASLFARLGGREGLLRLLRQFYADVRQHREIGPIFSARIQHWPAHIEKIADFWTSATGGPPAYAGPMPQRHFPLGLEPQHFQAWLELWRRNCRIQLPAREADDMITLAENIGERLQFMVERERALSARPPL